MDLSEDRNEVEVRRRLPSHVFSRCGGVHFLRALDEGALGRHRAAMLAVGRVLK